MKRWWTAGGALLARKPKLFTIAPFSCEGFTLARLLTATPAVPFLPRQPETKRGAIVMSCSTIVVVVVVVVGAVDKVGVILSTVLSLTFFLSLSSSVCFCLPSPLEVRIRSGGEMMRAVVAAECQAWMLKTFGSSRRWYRATRIRELWFARRRYARVTLSTRRCFWRKSCSEVPLPSLRLSFSRDSTVKWAMIEIISLILIKNNSLLRFEESTANWNITKDSSSFLPFCLFHDLIVK